MPMPLCAGAGRPPDATTPAAGRALLLLGAYSVNCSAAGRLLDLLTGLAGHPHHAAAEFTQADQELKSLRERAGGGADALRTGPLLRLRVYDLSMREARPEVIAKKMSFLSILCVPGLC